ncbi:MAG TPA: tetratricopeptide repeat protein [Geothermobacteraceae bacterium]|nr:tetratricopeptide repeat protein [Geothermobacteraceae bacterium]
MARFIALIASLWLASSALAAGPAAPRELQDLYFGEALYDAYQGEWFDAIARLDTELAQHHGLDQPELDTLYPYLGQAEFDVGDFELAYRMHRRAGRAITAVIEGNVAEPVRNAAIYRLARIYFQKDQPVNAQHALERIQGEVPAALRDDLAFLRAQVLMANGRFSEAEPLLQTLLDASELAGFASYNLGIALIRDGHEEEGHRYLDRTGLLDDADPASLAIRDKANLVLGDKLLETENFSGAKEVLDRVRLSGPFSNRALLGSGWADAHQERFDRALVPWTLLAGREVTDSAVQEALLAVPYAYGKLGVYSKAALLYGNALETFGVELDKLDASIRSIREGRFLQALTREELTQDANWVVRLRDLPETPETYYLLDLMASHDFQSALRNYLDLEQLRRKLTTWQRDLDAFAEIIEIRQDYYQPLLPEIDHAFRRLDSQMRLRLEQRDRIAQRLQALLVAPRPDYLATAEERIIRERLAQLERKRGAAVGPSDNFEARIGRLRGVLEWNIVTDYDRRLTEAHRDLGELDRCVEQLRQQYAAFVRTRQAATQSYQGYDETIRSLQLRIGPALERVAPLLARQGHQLEVMAENELTRRRERLAEFQVKARFAMADSYDRAARNQTRKQVEP